MKNGFSISLDRNQLKYIAAAAMLIDHIAWGFVPEFTAAWQIMHIIGRIAAPVMAYFIVEGYIYTHDRVRYGIRLLVFAFISWIPVCLFDYCRLEPYFGVIYTLFLGYLAICVWDNAKIAYELRILLVVGLCLLSKFGDWEYFDVLWPFFFYVFKDDERKKWTTFCIIGAINVADSMMIDMEVGLSPLTSIYQVGVFIVPFLIKYMYNGRRGNKNAFNKWFFYIFYPLHLLILGALRHHEYFDWDFFWRIK